MWWPCCRRREGAGFGCVLDDAAWLGTLWKRCGSGVFLKSHGYIGAQKEFELKDGPKGRRLRRSPKAILDFKFFLRLRLTVQFKARRLHSSSFELAWTRSAGRQKK